MSDEFEPTDVEQSAIAKAVRRLSGHGRDEDAMAAVARTALHLLAEAVYTRPSEDPPIAASIPMPVWNAPSGLYPMVHQPPLDLMGDIP